MIKFAAVRKHFNSLNFWLTSSVFPRAALLLKNADVLLKAVDAVAQSGPASTLVYLFNLLSTVENDALIKRAVILASAAVFVQPQLDRIECLRIVLHLNGTVKFPKNAHLLNARTLVLLLAHGAVWENAAKREAHLKSVVKEGKQAEMQAILDAEPFTASPSLPLSDEAITKVLHSIGGDSLVKSAHPTRQQQDSREMDCSSDSRLSGLLAYRLFRLPESNAKTADYLTSGKNAAGLAATVSNRNWFEIVVDAFLRHWNRFCVSFCANRLRAFSQSVSHEDLLH